MTENISQFWPTRIGRRPDPTPGREDDTLRELWLAARRQWPLVALLALLGLALGVLHYATSPRQYYASATLLIEERQNDLEQEISALRPLTRNDTGFENQMQILQSRQLAEAVVRQLDLRDRPDILYPPRSMLGGLKDDAKGFVKSLIPQPARQGTTTGDAEGAEDAAIRKAAAALSERMRFARIGRSYSVEIGALSADPAAARDLANTFAEAYLSDGTRTNLEESGRTAAWMKERIEDIQRTATEATIEAERFRAENGAMDQQGLREREQRVEALNALYVALEARYQEHLLAGSYPVPNGRILSAALLPERPAEPSGWRILLAGLAAGMMLGLAFAVIRELREKGFRTARDVEGDGLPFLGYLPVFDRRRPVPVAAPLPEARPGTDMFRASQGRGLSQTQLPALRGMRPGHGFDAAAYRVLLSSEIDTASRDARGRLVGVGGLLPGEGASTLAEALARQSSLSGRRTLLVDGDPARTLSHRLAGADPEMRGAGDLWSGLVRLSSGADFLPVPRMPGADAMRSTILANTLAAARMRYDIVLVDLPPVGFDPAAMALTRALDAVVVVLRWGRTPRSLLQSALARDPELRQRVAGVALNRTRLSRLGKYGVPAEERRALA